MQHFFDSRLLISVITVVFYIGLSISLSIMKNRYKQKNHSTNTLGSVFLAGVGAARALAFLIGLCIILSVYGINVAALVTGLGIVSAIVGLALQDTLKDIIMGIHILADHFFSVGEMVVYKGDYYTVVGFNLITTKLGNSADHSIYSICNREITNIQRMSSRWVMKIPVPFTMPQAETVRILEQCCKEIEELPTVIKTEFKGLDQVETYGLIYRVLVFENPSELLASRRPAYSIVRRRLEENGVIIPCENTHISMARH